MANASDIQFRVAKALGLGLEDVLYRPPASALKPPPPCAFDVCRKGSIASSQLPCAIILSVGLIVNVWM